MKTTLVIHKHGNLKKPLYSWVLENNLGGSCSNSGMHDSLIKCLAHARAMGININGPVTYRSDNDGDNCVLLRDHLNRTLKKLTI